MRIITAQDLNELTGMASWVNVPCHDCDSHVDVAVQLGEDPDYESSWARICLPCLEKACVLARTELRLRALEQRGEST